MAGEIAYPGRWIPEELVAELCLKWTGQADTVNDPYGSTKAQVWDWLASVGIGKIDMASLLTGDDLALRTEMQQQNDAGLPQILTVADEAYLYESGTRKPLHPWVDANDPNHTVYSHVMLRVGYSDDHAYGLYMDPAAPAFSQPVKIDWADMRSAGIITAIAIFPHGVSSWPLPPPKPTLDVAKVEVTLAAALTALSAAQAGLANLAQDLQALKQEV